LRQLEDYNKFDCYSTRLCRDWLLGIRPPDSKWFVNAEPASEQETERREEQVEAEAATEELQDALLGDFEGEELEWREVLGYLLDYHRREDKSEWWAMFHRMEMDEEELIDDSVCLGRLVQDTSRSPIKEKKSLLHFFQFPAQDTKMRVGDAVLRSDTGKSCGSIFSLDAESGEISLKIGPKTEIPPSPFSLIPNGPRRPVVLQEAVARFASAVAAGKTKRYRAVTSILRKELPRMSGIAEGKAIAQPGDDLVSAVTKAVSQLKESHLLIQGPPGTGKTFTSAHAIVQLLKAGKRVGVASNSHKAINNLLEWIEKVAVEKRVKFAGVKKGSGEEDAFNGSLIVDTTDNGEAADIKYNLVAGTAWLFSRPEMDQTIDHLFIDEAGQVCLANVVAMGTAAKNIVLIGDQMQLSQVSKGIHPAKSGVSALEHLLCGHATVPPERGILLNVTRRLHPSICSFISDAVYEGRLEPHESTAKRFIIAGKTTTNGIRESGIAFIDVDHEGNGQCSEEEVEAVKAAYSALLKRKWNDGAEVRSLKKEDILVVTPYNMQVNLLKAALPAGARVGTVDKFQGQEAAVVLVSMATSSGEELPRNIEFLFSRQRLNVAISRAQCLAMVFASPRLLEVSCKSIEQVKLVNTLCWAKEYAGQLPSGIDV
nr:AAA family ATPase [Gemmatimonadaceae bacterium]